MLRALVLSIGAHLLVLVLFAVHKPQNELRAPLPTKTLSTRVLSEKEFLKETAQTKRAQLVQTDEQLKTKEAPLDHQEVFLGRHNQRVDQNTRAARVGAFKNVLKEGLKDARDLFKIESETPPDRAPASITKDESQGQTTRFPASVAGPSPTPGDGHSATDDYLPHMAIGANTLLNTREYKYASFFERIREKLNHQWQTRLRSEMEGLYLQGVRGFSGERLTKLRVILDSHGAVKRIIKEGSAGYVELDRAAVGAFQAAAPFPNPPKDLLEGSEATLSIDWHFVVMGNEDLGLRMRVDRVPAGFR
jgi:TonB family protein